MIPQYRGAFRSRRFESVVSEATRLFSQGVKEINLIGQDTTYYGEDLGLKDGLPTLLESICSSAPELKWIRLMYQYPGAVSDRLIEVIRELPQPCHIGFEATGNYHRPLAYRLLIGGFDVSLHSYLARARYRVAILNARDKSDQKDAGI